MSQHLIKSILNKCFLKQEINILTAVSHERFEPNLAKVDNTRFWSWQGRNIRTWNEKYSPIPSNYHILNPDDLNRQIPAWVDIDLIICHNFFAHMEVFTQIANQLNVPILNIWHILPPKNQGPIPINSNWLNYGPHVFITEFNRQIWNLGTDNETVIEHGVDTEFWSPDKNVNKDNIALSVCNDWINRDEFCGFSLWKNGVYDAGLKCHVVGNTPGLSEPANSLEDLRDIYRKCSVFVNTSLWSPVPCSLLEAMSCELVPVVANNCMMPKFIKHGVNGYLFDEDKPEELTMYTKELLENPEKAREMGVAARKTIEERFGMDRFIESFEKVIMETIR